MSAETELRALLLAATAVTALIGNRIASDRIEQGTARPFVMFTRTATTPYVTIDGQVLASQAQLEIQCWADSRAQADAVGEAVTAAIRASTTQTVTGQSAAYDGELDLESTLLTVEWWT